MRAQKAPDLFRIAGRVVATRLPEGVITPGKLLIKRDSTAGTMARPRNLRAESGRSGGGFLSANPSEIVTESDAVIEIRIRAASQADAMHQANEKHIRPLVAALTIATGQPAHVELIRMARERPDGTIDDEGWSTWSDFAMMTNLGAMPSMEAAERNSVIGMIGLFAQDRVGSRAAEDLVEGMKMRWTAGGRTAELEGATLRLFLVIERVASRVSASQKPTPAEFADQQRVVNSLKRDLQRAPTATAVRQIRNAATALQKAEAKRLVRDIHHASTELGLRLGTQEAALDLNKLRNQSLAHPGSARIEANIAKNASLASDTALEFLAGYARWTSRLST